MEYCGDSCPTPADRAKRARAQPWMRGSVATGAGELPLVPTRLNSRDLAGGWAARWGIGRSRYRVPAGLYGVGSPSPSSPVLVTANYKLSFDALRRELAGIDAWILVLETNGVNVWCAAGKGTFGTEELLRRIEATKLEQVVEHRRLIVPQLGATGVRAVEVSRRSGFSVRFGPVRAADLPGYLAAGLKKNPAMRRVRFGLRERLAVVPVEITHALPYAAGVLAVSAFLVLARRGSLDLAASFRLALPVWGAMGAGILLTPMLLPLLPGKPFSLKGATVGLAWALVACMLLRPDPLGVVAVLLLLPAIAAFLALSYTGSTTFTSLSGVNAEVRAASPPIGAAAVAGAVLYVVAALTGGMA